MTITCQNDIDSFVKKIELLSIRTAMQWPHSETLFDWGNITLLYLIIIVNMF